MAQQFAEQRREVAEQFAEQRRETAQLRLEMARGLRHNLMVTIGLNGAFAVVLMAFIEYRLAG